MASSGFSSSVGGLSGVEWVSNNHDDDGETWLVVLEGNSSAVPQAFRLTDGEFREERGRLPFRSQVIARFKVASQARARRMARIFLSSLAYVAIASIALAFLTGSFQLRMVLTDSMSGTFEPGDVLAVVSPRFVNPEEGSVIAFHYYDTNRSQLVGDFSHRIIGGDAETGWETKGDANPVPDLSPVLAQDVIGVVIGWIPRIGYLVQPSNLLVVAMVVLVWMVVGPEVRGLLSRNRRKR